MLKTKDDIEAILTEVEEKMGRMKDPYRFLMLRMYSCIAAAGTGYLCGLGVERLLRWLHHVA